LAYNTKKVKVKLKKTTRIGRRSNKTPTWIGITQPIDPINRLQLIDFNLKMFYNTDILKTQKIYG